MISVITYGRNDNYSFNLVKRTALSFNCLAEILTEEDEILFVDYNTPDHLPTLPEFIWDTLSEKALDLIKVIRISSAIHERIKSDSPLPILECVSRNAAIIRSNPNNHWLLSTNPDVILVLASRWQNLVELLRNQPDSFYEMPRFDIPESIWSSLPRDQAHTNAQTLRDWLIAHNAAVAETMADFRFQRFYLFDAPGDFQLAPRSYFFRVRGFDERMNKYFHSDSNLAKRLWLLNGERTDHLLGHLWVLHQDHYLSGEWTKTVTTIQHNDYYEKVINQKTLEANYDNWGLQDIPLPHFSLAEKIRRQRVSLPQLPSSSNGNLPLSREVDWRAQPVYRLCNYQPEVLTLYLREVLQVVAPESKISYLGRSPQVLDRIRQTWQEISPQGHSVQDLVDQSEPDEYSAPDVLLVDCFYERSEYWEQRIRLLEDQLRRNTARGRISELEANEELSRFADTADCENLEQQLLPLWNNHFSGLTLRTGAHVILLGCNIFVPIFEKFQELLGELALGVEIQEKSSWLQQLHASYQKVKYRMQEAGERNPALKTLWALRLLKRRAFRKTLGYDSIMGWIYFWHITKLRRLLIKRMNLRTLYTHHRLVVMQVEPSVGKEKL